MLRRFTHALVCVALLASYVAIRASLPEGPETTTGQASRTEPEVAVTEPSASLESRTSVDLFLCYKNGPSVDAGCFEQVLLSSIQRDGTQVAMLGFNEHLSLHPESAPWCHSAAHAAGNLAFSLDKDTALAKVLSYGGTSCIMGYVHGVLEGFASRVTEASEVVKTIKACSDAFGDTPETGTCYDGVGHAAWIATEDLRESVGICSAMPSETHKQTCEMGVMMQIFEPAHAKASLEMGQNRIEAAKFCALWPTYGQDEEKNLKGCWRGASYLLGKGLTDKWFASDKSPVSGDFDKWAAVVVDSFKPCDLLGDRGSEACYAEAGSYLIGDWQGHDLELAVKLCQALPKAGQECADQSRAVASNYGWS